jgi:hypothetical protein
MRHGTAVSRWHYEPVAEGEQGRRAAWLLLVAGIPASALAWQVWSHVFVGPGPRVAEPRFEGWGAVLVMLPASLLVVGTALASLVMAARAEAAHVQGAERVFWLAAFGLLLVLMALGVTSADDVQAGASSTTEWAVRLVALAVTAVVAGVARWWAYERGT